MQRPHALLPVIALILPVVLSAQTLSVQVKKGVLKATPSFLSKTVSTLSYGEQVHQLSIQSDWINVKSASGQGWLHKSSLTDKTIQLQSGKQVASSSVSSNEMVLAGKGFNKQVESAYKKENPEMRFDLVDRMERYQVSDNELREFARIGQLKQ